MLQKGASDNSIYHKPAEQPNQLRVKIATGWGKKPHLALRPCHNPAQLMAGMGGKPPVHANAFVPNEMPLIV
jgi:hypothetical protein